MVENIVIREVTSSETKFIINFLNESPEAVKSFRYFENRPLEVVLNHIVTIVAINNEMTIGYGHLDKESDTIWFGVAVSDNFKGMGIGKKLMKYLIDYADKTGINELKLSVDLNNDIAIKMYEKSNFIVEKKLESNVLIMKRRRNGI